MILDLFSETVHEWSSQEPCIVHIGGLLQDSRGIWRVRRTASINVQPNVSWTDVYVELMKLPSKNERVIVARGIATREKGQVEICIELGV